MTVAEFIEKLKEFPLDLEVNITDSFKFVFYEGDFEFQAFESADGSTFVSISVSGFDEVL